MISEITSPLVRGRFLIIINFFVSIGKIYAFLLAYYFLDNFHSGNWRIMMCVSSFTSLIVGILALCFLMESPRYLIANNRVIDGINIVEEMIHKNHNNSKLIKKIFTTVEPEISKEPFEGSKYILIIIIL